MFPIKGYHNNNAIKYVKLQCIFFLLRQASTSASGTQGHAAVAYVLWRSQIRS